MFKTIVAVVATAAMLGGVGLTLDSASANPVRHGAHAAGGHGAGGHHFAGHGVAGHGFAGHGFAGHGFAGHGFAGHGFGRPGGNFHRFAGPLGGNVWRHALGGGAFAHALGGLGLGRHFAGGFAPRGAMAGLAAGAAGRGGFRFDHRHGWFPGRGFQQGYVGWAGPVFWPYAYDNLFDYAFDPYDDADSGDLFWDYGYDDLFAGILMPYAFSGPASGVGVAGSPSPSASATASSSGQACGSTQLMSGGVATGQIATAVKPTGDQSDKLDALKTAEANAGKTLAATCAGPVPTTAEGRLDAVQTRLEAMVQAADVVSGPLDGFYSSLSDEQKAAFNALGQTPLASKPGAAAAAQPTLAQLCGPDNAVPVVASDQIANAIQPNAQQQASLGALSDAANKADQAILASCPARAPLTPPGRLDAIHGRLQAMLSGVDLVKPALQNFYASLDDTQKARFDALTLPPSSAAAATTTTQL